jgi:hypothetical protein
MSTPYCEMCRKSFKTLIALRQHEETARAHKHPRQAPSHPQISTEVKVRPSKAIQQELAKSVKSEALADGEHQLLEHKASKLKNSKSALAPSLNVFQVASSTTTNPKSPQSPWAVIPEYSYIAVLNTLSEHCHSASCLKHNGFILDLYDPLTSIFKSGKCKRCGSQFPKSMS